MQTIRVIPKEIMIKGITRISITPLYWKSENKLLRQRLEEALRANDELTHQLQQTRRNPPGRPSKKSSRRTQAAETETATVQAEPQARTESVTCQATRAAIEMQTQAP